MTVTAKDPMECMIVGGGLIGMLSAMELAAGGCRVRLLERAALAQESTWAGGGILSPLYPWRYPPAVSALAAWGQAHYPAFCAKLQADTGLDPEYARNGLLVLDTQEQTQARYWADAYRHALEILDARAIQSCEPRLGAPPEAALWLPEVGQVRNPRLAKALRRALALAGVEILEYTEVLDFILQGDTLAGIRTDRESLSAECVVVAAGAWSGELLKQAGVDLAVKPIRGQMLLFKTEPGLVSRIVLAQNRYVIPRRDGRVLVGSTLEDVGFAKATTAEARAALEQSAYRLVPALRAYPVEHHWAGLRPGSPDGIPCIGPHPRLRGLYFNTGHFRNGVVLGLASARLLGDILLGRAPTFDPAAYSVAALNAGHWAELNA